MIDTDEAKALRRLAQIARQVAGNDYSQTKALFEMAGDGAANEAISDMAESFGMMMVKLEGREYRLERLISDLKKTNQQLEDTLKKVRLLESVKTHLSKFVPKTVKTLIQANPETPDLAKHSRDVSVMFLDVTGYTRMSQKVSATQMNFLVERYFSAFIDDVTRNSGDIVETAGDGLMIVFQHDEPAQTALNAVNSAVCIQGKVSAINRETAGRNEPVSLHIGINSGICSLGSTRFEGLSGHRWTYTASGTVTVTAARIGELAEGGKIYIGPETRRRVTGHFELLCLGVQRLKYIETPIPIWEVLSGIDFATPHKRQPDEF